jgi:hypothetical protein
MATRFHLAVCIAALNLPTTIWAESGSKVEIHYAPRENLEAVDVQEIARAELSIDMAAYVLSDPQIIEALTDAAERGVVIRLYLDRSQFAEHGPTRGGIVEALVAHPNVEARVKGEGVLMHLKAYAVDGEVLRTGSGNSPGPGSPPRTTTRSSLATRRSSTRSNVTSTGYGRARRTSRRSTRLAEKRRAEARLKWTEPEPSASARAPAAMLRELLTIGFTHFIASSKSTPNCSKSSQARPCSAKGNQRKKTWISLDSLGGNEPFQGVAPTPQGEKSCLAAFPLNWLSNKPRFRSREHPPG